MVFIRDDGTFDAPIDKIWKYLNDMPGEHDHSAIVSMEPLEQHGQVAKLKVTQKGHDGKPFVETWQLTSFQPDGQMLEILEGRGKGTKHVHTYIPQGNKTRVVVVGDFHIQGLDDASTKKTVLDYLNNVFNEDNRNLQEFS
ncbi:MAG: SRPBCC family protein [Thermoplasmatota archaeon]